MTLQHKPERHFEWKSFFPEPTMYHDQHVMYFENKAIHNNA